VNSFGLFYNIPILHDDRRYNSLTLVRRKCGYSINMNKQYWVEQRITEQAAKRTPQDNDRFECEGGPGPQDTRNEPQDVPTEIAQPELTGPVATPTCGGTGTQMQSDAGDCMIADPSQVIVTAGATAHSVQVHHLGIPELQSHGESAESAMVKLAEDLAREIDVVVDNLHREPLQRALDDVKASSGQAPDSVASGSTTSFPT
jgi:hypothetical protein